MTVRTVHAGRVLPLIMMLLASLLALGTWIDSPAADAAAKRRLNHKPLLDTIGVVSANSFHDLSDRRAWADMRKLTNRDDVDIVGWQEGEKYHHLYRRLARKSHDRFDSFMFRSRARELVVSWRADTFRLLDGHAYKAHDGIGVGKTRWPFPSRWTMKVKLQHIETGRRITVLNAHVNHKTEDKTRPGTPYRNVNARKARVHIAQIAKMWNRQRTKYTVGVGDFNFSHYGDKVRRPRGFMRREFAGKAVSNWEAMSPPASRYRSLRTAPRLIDYVYLPTKDFRHDMLFARQEHLRGYNSDHRPVLARVALYGRPKPGY